MKYEFIRTHRSEFAVKKMCLTLDVSRSGYYDWQKRPESQRSIANRALLEAIEQIHSDKHKQCYGSPRITEELNALGLVCSRSRIARLMNANDIVAKTVKKYKATTDSDHSFKAAPNLLRQDFWTDAANLIWMSDITYIQTWKGWLYLTVIMDLYNRKVVGWSMSNRMTANTTTIPAFIQAVKQFKPLPGLILHSDRGVQYACDDFRDLLDAFSVTQSMSGKGNCYDNAVVESFFHTLKTELVYHETYQTRKAARTSLFEYIEVFYNRIRKHSALGYKSPEQYEQFSIKQTI
jgi:transposase InsO family protein